MKMTAGERLKYLIKNKGLKITEFSKKTGINYRTLQGYISGEMKPGYDALTKIYEVFNISIDWLISGEGEIYREEQPKEKITTFKSKLFLNWLDKWWENADEKHRNWLEIQLKRCFPEYTEWLSQQEKG
jgi:transcriptional regulator with XRE-family HTH domain